MQKEVTFYIREKSYEYGDDFNYYTGLHDDISFATNDRIEALQKFERLEREVYRNPDLVGTLTAFTEDEYNQGFNALEKLKAYYEATFDIYIDLRRVLDFNKPVLIPKKATDEQVDEIRKILGVNFHVIVEVEKANSYFLIEYNNIFFADFYNEVPANYASQKDAQTAGIQYTLFCLFGPDREQAITGISGSLSTLSNTPLLLEKYLEQSNYFSYDYETCKIQARLDIVDKWDWEYPVSLKKELRGLIPLLKIQPFSISEIKL